MNNNPPTSDNVLHKLYDISRIRIKTNFINGHFAYTCIRAQLPPEWNIIPGLIRGYTQSVCFYTFNKNVECILTYLLVCSMNGMMFTTLLESQHWDQPVFKHSCPTRMTLLITRVNQVEGQQ